MSAPWYSGNPAVNDAISAAIVTDDAASAAALSTAEALDVKLAGETVSSDVTAGTLLMPAGLAGEILFANNASAQTLQLPQDSDATYAIGAHVTVIQIGAGLLTFAAGTGATMNKVIATGKTLGRYSRVTVTKTAANTWNVNGDLSAT